MKRQFCPKEATHVDFHGRYLCEADAVKYGVKNKPLVKEKPVGMDELFEKLFKGKA